ncbi:MAG: DUF1566 domain-containing protein [Desulfatirhabdiaceae bacterium]
MSSGQDGYYLIHAPSYAKLDQNGQGLPDSATSWAMILDTTTGLIWENKTDDGSVHDADNTYTWYDSNAATNGGNAGTSGVGTDTEDFLKSLNDSKFGSYSDWRLPTVNELSYMVNRSQVDPSIDRNYFVNTKNSAYWTSTTASSDSAVAWTVHFSKGNAGNSFKNKPMFVRAVRSGQAVKPVNMVDNGDGTVTDVNTGLMWQKETAKGKTWDAALNYSETLTLGGFTDWRLPNIHELKSIVDYGKYDPAIDMNVFPGSSASWYWSSTTYVGTPQAWLMNYLYGLDGFGSKDYTMNVRAVRGGQIQKSGNLFITSPAVGDVWSIGTQKTIRWDTSGIKGNVNIYLSIDGGYLYYWFASVGIVNPVANTGSYTWTVDVPPGYEDDVPLVNCSFQIVPDDYLFGDRGSFSEFFTIGPGGAIVDAPTFSPDPGYYSASTTVTLSCSTPGATIRYTTDNSEPTETSTIYVSPLTLTSTTTIKAKAYISATEWSSTAVATYTFLDPSYQVKLTSVTPNSGPLYGGTFITLTGENFLPGITVSIGGNACTAVNRIDDTELTCTNPSHDYPEIVDIVATNPDGKTAVLAKSFTYKGAQTLIRMPDDAVAADNIQIPVTLSNVQGLVAADVTITYDPTVLTIRDAQRGDMISEWYFDANLSTPGTVRLAMGSPGASVSSSGTLALVDFDVIGGLGETTPLTFTDVKLNDGAIDVDLDHGLFTVETLYSISGTVQFWKTGSVVPDTEVTATGGNGPYTGTSTIDGTYKVDRIQAGNYTLTPSKTNKDEGISAYDASLILRHANNRLPLTDKYELLAADVNKTGYITSMDAFYVLQRAVGLIELPFPGNYTIWEFDPVNYVYNPLSANQTSQNFKAVYIGDVSGNWKNTPAVFAAQDNKDAAGMLSSGSATLSFPDISIAPNGASNIALNIELSNASFIAADLWITYDPDVISIESVSMGTLFSDGMVASNLNTPGLAKIAIAGGGDPVTENGTLINMAVTATGELGTFSVVSCQRAELNEGNVPVVTDEGLVLVEAAVENEDKGNINGDLYVDLTDAILCYQILAGLSPELDLEAKTKADVNGDGKIGLAESIYILQRIAGIQ